MANRKGTNGQTILYKNTKLKIKDRATRIPLKSVEQIIENKIENTQLH
jgi:hypothetical protein